MRCRGKHTQNVEMIQVTSRVRMCGRWITAAVAWVASCWAQGRLCCSRHEAHLLGRGSEDGACRTAALTRGSPITGFDLICCCFMAPSMAC